LSWQSFNSQRMGLVDVSRKIFIEPDWLSRKPQIKSRWFHFHHLLDFHLFLAYVQAFCYGEVPGVIRFPQVSQ
jgi:hypothetical protein